MTTKNLITCFLIITTIIISTSCSESNVSEEKNANIKKANLAPIFDIPSLIGKDIDGVRKILGKPTDKEIEPSNKQMKMNFDTWDNSFKKDNRTLLVSFNPKNRKVINFFIETTDPSGTTSDYSDLLQLCNLTSENDKYTIEPVPTIKDNTRFSGIKILAK